MGVKHSREYTIIIEELMSAVMQVDNFYQFVEMTQTHWQSLDISEQVEMTRTIADDLLYGLELEANIELGSGLVSYDRANHTITVSSNDQLVKQISLV